MSGGDCEIPEVSYIHSTESTPFLSGGE